MSGSQWLGVLLYVVLTTAVGGMLVRSFSFREPGLPGGWASRYLAGQLVLTILTLLTGFVPISISVLLRGVTVMAALYWGYVLIWRRVAFMPLLRGALAAAGFVLLMAALFPGLALVVQSVPLWEWDARSNWFFHGKAIALAGGVTPAFFANSLYEWSHHDYPILIPAQSAWNALMGVGWNDYSVKAFLGFNFSAYVWIFMTLVREKGLGWWGALVLAVFVFDREGYSYVSGCADNHYVVTIFLGLLALSLGPGKGGVALAVLLCSFAANVKSEGTMYVILMAAGAFVLRVAAVRFRRGDDAGASAGVPWRVAGWGALVGVLPVVMWAVFRAVHHIRNDLDLVNRLGQKDLMLGLLAERWKPILAYGWDFYMAKGALFLLVLAIALTALRWHAVAKAGGRGVGITDLEWAVWGLFILSQTLIFVVYVATPLDLTFHLGTSATRLLFFPFMLLIFLNTCAAMRWIVAGKVHC